jgi:hypothetical protein
MLPLNAPALRYALNAAEKAYLDAQHSLLGRIDLAVNGLGEWPIGGNYAHTAELGHAAAQVRREYLAALGVERHSHKRMERGDRLELIQRLSAAERKWQPQPEDWLKKHDQQDWP